MINKLLFGFIVFFNIFFCFRKRKALQYLKFNLILFSQGCFSLLLMIAQFICLFQMILTMSWRIQKKKLKNKMTLRKIQVVNLPHRQYLKMSKIKEKTNPIALKRKIRHLLVSKNTSPTTKKILNRWHLWSKKNQKKIKLRSKNLILMIILELQNKNFNKILSKKKKMV